MENSNDRQVASILRRAILDCIAIESLNNAAASTPRELFESPAAQALKAEIIRTGRKLWERAYVDGNGGNISARLSDEYVLCTPTLCSKGDISAADLSLVDLENSQLCGDRAQTSEILLHLEIYKAVPNARAVVHCHPPYATAHAMAGVVPPGNLIPEQEVFVGPVALAPYETPGTLAFARTVLPFVKDHNTILLTNHGVVCWSDTVAHAEWCVEVVENYCKTVMIARQLKPSLPEIPPEKILDLLALKKRYGLPDPRLAQGVQNGNEGSADRAPNSTDSKPTLQANGSARPALAEAVPRQEIERLVSTFTAQLMDLLKTKA
jgi:L-fuculose-phosphate aldolase